MYTKNQAIISKRSKVIPFFICTKNLKSIGVRDEMGGQGQYRVGRSRIGGAGSVSAVPLPKVRLSAFRKISLGAFFGWLGQKNWYSSI